MNLIQLMEDIGEVRLMVLGGLLIGALFGFFAQRSRFCMRSAVIEVSRREMGGKLAVWLLAFAVAVAGAQALILLGQLNVGSARQLASAGSLSGALIGGLLFGAGMILARGCSSRMLVLSANGNMRALLSGLVFAVTAQSALSGVLAPLRNSLAGLWTLPAGGGDLLAALHVGNLGGLIFGLAWLLGAAYLARRNRVSPWGWAGGLGVGAMVVAAWWFNYRLSVTAFEPVPVQSLSFTGPSADLLMLVLLYPGAKVGFSAGLVPGVFLGSFIAGLLARELKLEGFGHSLSMGRYLTGGVFMGFGGMLAGGCAVGAGVSGAAVFALTSWVTLSAMWAGAAATDWVVDRAGLLSRISRGSGAVMVNP